MTSDLSTSVTNHWHQQGSRPLIDRIDEALRGDGNDPLNLTVDALLAVDEFHIRGREATEELADLAAIDGVHEVLDVGSGLGGPSRYLASRFGCRVTGIDLTAEYCATASTLAQRTGLADRVDYQEGNALDLPFPDDRFDIAWTQHISMNIPDKTRMFSEMKRVVKPGGRLVIYDPIRGSEAPLQFPVPWSRDGAISFLIDSAEFRSLLDSLGLVIETWNDVSEKSLAWFARNAAQPAAQPPALGLHLLLGDQWSLMARNMAKNIAEKKLRVVQVIARCP